MAIAQQTVEIVKQGRYDLANGRAVEIAPLVDFCLAATRFYLPEQLEATRRSVLASVPEGDEATIEVRNESTLAGIFRPLAETSEPVAGAQLRFRQKPGRRLSQRQPGPGRVAGPQFGAVRLAAPGPGLLRASPGLPILLVLGRDDRLAELPDFPG